jgi:Small integral membrane protein (DUF2273).
MNLEKFLEIYSNNKGKISGVLLGLLFGILVISIGFLKTLFLSLCVCLGYIIGKKIDNNEDLIYFIEKILNTHDKRF